jgi:hypothetical protein
MAILTLTREQVLNVIAQLPPEDMARLLRELLLQRWDRWMALSVIGAQKARALAAARGRDWDTMTEDERETLIDDVLHDKA